ncbi:MULTISPECIES: zinc-binding dehydrogenase [Streptomyces]|uniref:zinc-binding dehydrogenase n=1 Tax=Streptomyces TaxID=1883 RepID=UPI00103BF813|nr:MULTISPECIES: zinc-binding dehydrogenase [Streptomyces]MBT3076557.1 zinc-binding dehydrogenase [Streptomyces sp. COG21]MBT3078929.1 zinc-binding dehydrogenase [Streptomyces sp. COG20]MBT3087798.1 zinc-binding dehydrogenase [Streptomyces sp. CYG21]MBT3107204.1 zinc-binding dehydrogenase [Streptomyces sp. COG19]MDI7788530.1 zinc-binding dehydrogenase [Streptomyces cavourensis]
MHAVRLHAFGPAENLTYERIEDPVPGPGQVRIAVEAAGVHLLDTALREGRTGPYPAPAELPTVPGREVAGTVESVGEGTDPGWLGKRVVAHIGMAPGGYAELTVTEADKLHEIPAALGAAEAVAMIGTGRTTLGILGFTDLGPDSVAVVTAAAGGIGTLLVQYAKNAGATVIALAGGPAKVARAEENGADLALDYTLPDWPDRARAFLDAHGLWATVVFDSVGGATARSAVGLLGRGGQHVVYGWSGEGLHDGQPLTFTPEELAERGIASASVLGPRMIERGGGLRALETRALAEAAAGRLRPAVQRYPLAEAAAAHRALETRGTVGKVVLEP